MSLHGESKLVAVTVQCGACGAITEPSYWSVGMEDWDRPVVYFWCSECEEDCVVEHP